MNELVSAVALFLLLNVAAGLVRVVRGPTRADRMLVAQLLGTTGVAILLLLAESLQVPALRDVALVLALLATTATVVFVRLVWLPLPTEIVRGGEKDAVMSSECEVGHDRAD